MSRLGYKSTRCEKIQNQWEYLKHICQSDYVEENGQTHDIVAVKTHRMQG